MSRYYSFLVYEGFFTKFDPGFDIDYFYRKFDIHWTSFRLSFINIFVFWAIKKNVKNFLPLLDLAEASLSVRGWLSAWIFSVKPWILSAREEPPPLWLSVETPGRPVLLTLLLDVVCDVIGAHAAVDDRAAISCRESFFCDINIWKIGADSSGLEVLRSDWTNVQQYRYYQIFINRLISKIISFPRNMSKKIKNKERKETFFFHKKTISLMLRSVNVCYFN